MLPTELFGTDASLTFHEGSMICPSPIRLFRIFYFLVREQAISGSKQIVSEPRCCNASLQAGPLLS